MNDTNTEDLFLLFKKVIENTRVRAIIQMAGVADKFDNLPDNIFFLSEFVPYSFLFERCKIVVHHGGAGTAAAVCLSGALSVVVPHIVDQYFTGIRLHNLGVALPHIARKRLTADNLAAQIRHLLTDEAMKENAQKLAEQMRLEGGVASAVDSIERFVEERLKK